MKRKTIILLIAIAIIFGCVQQKTSTKSKGTYYPSIEAALKNSGLSLSASEEYQRTITKEIYRFENDDYLTLYYLALKNDDEGCLILAKFQKKHDGDSEKYRFKGQMPMLIHRGSYKASDGRELVKSNILHLNMYQTVNIDPDNTVFMCGDNGDKDIYKLKIDGQAPDGVVPYNVFGEERYFWYYENLVTKNSVDDMSVTMN